MELIIYDISGKPIKTIINETQNEGKHRVQWDGTNDLLQKVASGIYISRLKVNGCEKTRKMLMLK